MLPAAGSHHYTSTETHGGTMQMLNVAAQLPGGNRRMPPGCVRACPGLPAGWPDARCAVLPCLLASCTSEPPLLAAGTGMGGSSAQHASAG